MRTVRQLLERVSGARLTDERVDALVAEYDGWAVGLQSVALALRRGDATANLAGDLLAGDHRRLIGILSDEVFAMQPAEVRDFLLRTALVGQLTASLCQCLLTVDCAGEAATTASQARLEQLERDGLFIEALDEERRWYRYHNLVRTFLGYKLVQTYGSTEITALHRRAAAWYWQEGNAAEAIRHALVAEDTALAADVAEASLYAILNREEWPLLERWLRLLPGEAIQQRPLLLVAQAWVLFFQLKLWAIPRLLAGAGQTGVLDGTFQVEKHPRLHAWVALIHQHRTTFEQIAVAFQRQIEDCVQQRMAGTDEGCQRLALGRYQRLFKKQPLRSAAAPARQCQSAGPGCGWALAHG